MLPSCRACHLDLCLVDMFGTVESVMSTVIHERNYELTAFFLLCDQIAIL